jgi:hypothetical protein
MEPLLSVENEAFVQTVGAAMERNPQWIDRLYERVAALLEACAPNATEHARVMIEVCHGDIEEALDLAHMNCEFSHVEKDQNYWDRVAIAIRHLGETGVYFFPCCQKYFVHAESCVRR